MNILFICNQNKNRSKTAEELFKTTYNTKSAGLYSDEPVHRNQLEWADLIVVMEDEQRIELVKRFPEEVMRKRVISLNIPDYFSYGSSGLIQQLRTKMSGLI